MNAPVFQISIAFIIGLIIVTYSIPIVVKIAKVKKLFDEPNSRRVNKVPVPNLGGVSLFMGVSLATLIGFQNNTFPEFRYIMSSTIILLFIGIKDDLLVISARKKLLAQLVCAILIVNLGGIQFTNLHGILGISEINPIAGSVLSLFAIVSIINAINLIDGLDGLAASFGILGSVVLGINFYLARQVNFAILSAAIAGSLISFFIFNVFGKKNKIFMGDTGAMILGFLLSALIIKFNEISINGPENLISFSPVLTLSLIAIPLIDMIRLFFLRIRKNKSPFSADMNHIHHKILRFGPSHLFITGSITFFNVFLLILVTSFSSLNNNTLVLIIIIMVSAFITFPYTTFSDKLFNKILKRSKPTKNIQLSRENLIVSNHQNHRESGQKEVHFNEKNWQNNQVVQNSNH